MGRGGGGIKYLETFRDIGAFLWEGGGDWIKYLETFRDIGAVGVEGLIIIRHYSRKAWWCMAQWLASPLMNRVI